MTPTLSMGASVGFVSGHHLTRLPFSDPTVDKHSHDKRYASSGMSRGLWVHNHGSRTTERDVIKSRAERRNNNVHGPRNDCTF